jgi:hypothetical protein
VSAPLSAAWFIELNTRLAAAASNVPTAGDGTIRVVFAFDGAPDGAPHAMTFTVSGGVATVVPGDNLAADVIVRLNYEDATALAHGTLTGGHALRDGRLKVRGDTDALKDFGAWIVAAQAASAETSP